MALQLGTTRHKQKQKYFLLPGTNLVKACFIFLVSKLGGQKRDKSEFATKFVETIVTTIFMHKYRVNFYCTVSFHKSLQSQTVNKAFCRTLVGKSLLTLSTLVGELLNCLDCFLRLSGFAGLFGKVFLITFTFS